MKNIDTFFDNNDRARIRDAVSEAESHTSAEIVPVLTDCSGRYNRAEDLLVFSSQSFLWSFAGLIFRV